MLSRPVPLLGLVALGYLVLQAAAGPGGHDARMGRGRLHQPGRPRCAGRRLLRSPGQGVTWLVAPIVHFTTDPAAIRWWMMIVAAVGLFLAFLPWTRLLEARRARPGGRAVRHPLGDRLVRAAGHAQPLRRLRRGAGDRVAAGRAGARRLRPLTQVSPPGSPGSRC